VGQTFFTAGAGGGSDAPPLSRGRKAKKSPHKSKTHTPPLVFELKTTREEEEEDNALYEETTIQRQRR